MCRPETIEKKVAAEPDSDPAELEKGDEWLKKFDFVGFAQEIKELGKQLDAKQGPADVDHLNKMIMWSNCCAAVGLLSMGFGVNPITILALSLYTCTRWTMIAHHTCHGGYEKVHPNKSRWSRFKFAVGSFWRRFNDWFDWMMPEAWNVEHNNRHHYNLSEIHDPDLVEQNMIEIRESNAPVFVKYMMVAFVMLTWKWYYYAPNTYKELKLARLRRQGKEIPAEYHPELACTLKSAMLGQSHFYSLAELLAVVLLPYFVLHFFVAPLPFCLLGDHLDGYTGQMMYWTAVKNLFLAELLTNVHSFIIIVTNHAGDDMYRFREPCRPFSGSFYLRQVLASVDFDMGTDAVDFWHGWLNYQIEHHMWPNLSMLSYQKSAPQVQAICAKYGVPYIKENVFWRLKKTVDIMVGNASMKWFPESYEMEYLKTDSKIEAANYKKSQ
jgi:fatty acid desaturase